jgi:hypothetical protein
VSRYVVAVRREKRAQGVTTDRVRQVPGVHIEGGDAQRAIVEAAPAAAQELRRRFSDDFIVEPEILHGHG